MCVCWGDSSLESALTVHLSPLSRPPTTQNPADLGCELEGALFPGQEGKAASRTVFRRGHESSHPQVGALRDDAWNLSDLTRDSGNDTKAGLPRCPARRGLHSVTVVAAGLGSSLSAVLGCPVPLVPDLHISPCSVVFLFFKIGPPGKWVYELWRCECIHTSSLLLGKNGHIEGTSCEEEEVRDQTWCVRSAFQLPPSVPGQLGVSPGPLGKSMQVLQSLVSALCHHPPHTPCSSKGNSLA